MNYKNLKNDIMREYPVLVVNNITEITAREYQQLMTLPHHNLQVYDLSTNLCECVTTNSLRYYHGNYDFKSILIILDSQAPNDPYQSSIWATYNFYNALIKGNSDDKRWER